MQITTLFKTEFRKVLLQSKTSWACKRFDIDTEFLIDWYPYTIVMKLYIGGSFVWNGLWYTSRYRQQKPWTPVSAKHPLFYHLFPTYVMMTETNCMEQSPSSEAQGTLS
jgi:hypothetical protein